MTNKQAVMTAKPDAEGQTHYTDGRRWSHIHNAWIAEASWNDAEEIAQLRSALTAAKEELREKAEDVARLTKALALSGMPTVGYYLQDKRTFVGNDMLWWGVDGTGYTTDLRKAHVFTEEEFRKGASRATDVFWPVAYINSLARPVVDMQYAKLTEARKESHER